MKKLAILLVAFALLCSCLVLAACGDEKDDTSSAAGTSSTAGTSSAAGTSSTAEASKEESSAAASSEEVIETSSEPEASSEPETSEDQPATPEAKTFWLTHYNTIVGEGFGTIMTNPYSGGDWWIHVAFAPVEGEDGVWKIVDYVNGSDGSGHALDIPEGGFVYALHAGNDWISAGSGDTDYTSKANADMFEEAKTWKVGDKFTFTGIDFENFTEVPTTTPGVNWYEDKTNDPDDTDDYVCTATYTKVG